MYVEGSTAWLYDCPHFLFPLYKADRCFDRIPLHFKDTITSTLLPDYAYDYATPITCDNNPRNIIELDPDSDDQDFYILGPEPNKRKPPLMFTPSQIKTTIRPITFTAQDAGIYSNAELDQFWNRILFSKHSDSTLQILGKALSYSFISSNTPDYNANSPHDNPYNTLRFGLHDKLINLTPLFTPTWFSDAFIAFFGYPCYILTQCGIYFSTFLFIQATITLIIKLYKTISIKYNLKHNITLLISTAHGFFIILTAEMVNDLDETQNRKPKNTLLKSKSLDNFSDTSTNLINHSTGITSPPFFYTKRPNKLQMSKFKLFPKRHHFSYPKITLQTSTLPFSSHQHPSLPNYSNKHSHPNDNLATPHDTLTMLLSPLIRIHLLQLFTGKISFSSTTLLNFISVCLPTLFWNTSLLLHQSFLHYQVTIATPSSLETLLEIHIPQINSPPLILVIFKNSPSKVDKSTR